MIAALRRRFKKERCERILHVSSPLALHLRPAARFAQAAKSFACEISLAYRDKVADARDPNAILALGIDTGEHMTLLAEGKEAKRACDSLADLFEALMQEDRQKLDTQAPKADETRACPYETEALRVEALVKGVATAPLFILQSSLEAPDVPLPFDEALQRYREKLEKDALSQAQATLFESLVEGTDSLEAFEAKCERAIESLQGKQRAKADDYRDILRALKIASGYRHRLLLPRNDAIVIVETLLPSDVKLLLNSHVKGILLVNSSRYAHSALLLKEYGILSALIDTMPPIQEGAAAILDTRCGALLLHPSQADLQLAKEVDAQNDAIKVRAKAHKDAPALMRNGERVKVLANLGELSQIDMALEAGAEGVGLLRSEFLFKEQKPDIEMQTQTYKLFFDAFSEVTVRTLDVGGDKALPYIDIPKENNPFLGIRGIRLLQSHEALIAEQLLSILRAAQGHEGVKVMFPMIACAEEFDAAKALAQRIADAEGLNIEKIAWGIMIEVPSVLFDLERLNARVDFYSVGTNDLMQYLFAIERTHPTLRTDPLSPPAVAALRQIVKSVDKPLSLCGDLASQEEMIAPLLEIGFRTLSVAPSQIPLVKEKIRHV